MRVCAIITCNNEGVHRFPTDETMKRQWIKATRIDVQRKIGWHLRKYSYICSDHFTPSDFDIRGKLRPLKKTAVPSIFPWNPYPMPSEKSRREGPDIRFNPANALKNYSRSDLPIKFVEEYSTTNIEVTGPDIDPLRISDEEYPENTSDSNLSPVPDEKSYMVIKNTSENKDELTRHHKTYSRQNQISHCDQSVQTTEFTHFGPI